MTKLDTMNQDELTSFFKEYEHLLSKRKELEFKKQQFLDKMNREYEMELKSIPKETQVKETPKPVKIKKPVNGRLIILRNLIIIWILLMFLRTDEHVYSNLFAAFILSFIVTFIKFPILYLLSPITSRIKTVPKKQPHKPTESSTNYNTEKNKLKSKYLIQVQNECINYDYNIKLINQQLKPYQEKLPLQNIDDLYQHKLERNLHIKGD